MATTVEQVFDLTMALIDEILPNGSISASNTKDYKAKTTRLLSIAQIEIADIEGLDIPSIISSFDDELVISDRSSRLILPQYLASRLLLDENPNVAGFFNDRYEDLKRKIPSKVIPIIDVYGFTQDGDFIG